MNNYYNKYLKYKNKYVNFQVGKGILTKDDIGIGIDIDIESLIEIPESCIEFNVLNNLSILDREKIHLLPITHILLTKNIIYGMYFYDASYVSSDDLFSLKFHLNNYIDYIIETFSGKKEEFEKYKLLISTDEYWTKNTYYQIARMTYIINRDDIIIQTFNASISKKGGGHLLLCLFLFLFKIVMKTDNIVIKLKAALGTEEYYTNIGFNKDRDDSNYDYKNTINELITKCIELNKFFTSGIKIFLLKNKEYINDIFNFFNIIR